MQGSFVTGVLGAASAAADRAFSIILMYNREMAPLT